MYQLTIILYFAYKTTYSHVLILVKIEFGYCIIDFIFYSLF